MMMTKIAFTMWHLWKARNKAMFRDGQPHMPNVIMGLKRALEEFLWIRRDQEQLNEENKWQKRWGLYPNQLRHLKKD